MVNIEIIIGLIALAVLLAIFAPLMFDPRGVLEILVCDEDEILKYININGTLNWVCSIDDTSSTEIQQGTFANENTDFRPHLVQGSNVQDPIVNFGNYSIRVLEFTEQDEGQVSWDYLVPEDYEVGEDLEFTVYWIKEDGLSDPQDLNFYQEEVTACNTAQTQIIALTVEDGVEFDFIEGNDYMVYVTATFGGSSNNERVGAFVQHGTTQFEGSHSIIEPSSPASVPCSESDDMFSYEWFTIYTPDGITELEDISVVFENFGGGQSVFFDDVVINIGNLERVEKDVDYFFDQNSNSALLDDTNSFNTPNDASITFQPTHNGNSTWLVIGTASYCCEGDGSNKDFLTRFNFNGSATNLPLVQRENENSEQLPIESFHRTLILPNTTHTFEVESQLGVGDIVFQESRNSSSIFALKLTDNFSDFATFFDPDPIEIGEADFGTEIAQVNITATSDDRSIWIISDFGIQFGRNTEVRVQLDDVDTVADQTSQSYDFDHEYGSFDIERWQKVSIEPVLNGTHFITLDVSEGANQPPSNALERSLTVLLLESPALQPTNQTDTACMEVRLMSVDEGEDMSNFVIPTFGDFKEVCATTSGGADILRTLVFNFNTTEIPFQAGDVGIVQLKRDPIDSQSDDYIGKMFALFGELQWIVIPP